MPIFEKSGQYVLFVHIPKAGGTTIEQIFLKNGWTMHLFEGGEGVSNINPALRCSPQHWHGDLLKQLINPLIFTAIFCTMRHPIARIQSEYSWRRSYFNINEDSDTWINSALDSYISNPYIHDNHIRPQTEFIFSGVNIFKIENGLHPVMSYLNNTEFDALNYDNDFRAMKSKTIADNDFTLSDDTIERLSEFYKDDILLWNSIS